MNSRRLILFNVFLFSMPLCPGIHRKRALTLTGLTIRFQHNSTFNSISLNASTVERYPFSQIRYSFFAYHFFRAVYVPAFQVFRIKRSPFYRALMHNMLQTIYPVIKASETNEYSLPYLFCLPFLNSTIIESVIKAHSTIAYEIFRKSQQSFTWPVDFARPDTTLFSKKIVYQGTRRPSAVSAIYVREGSCVDVEVMQAPSVTKTFLRE